MVRSGATIGEAKEHQTTRYSAPDPGKLRIASFHAESSGHTYGTSFSTLTTSSAFVLRCSHYATTVLSNSPISTAFAFTWSRNILPIDTSPMGTIADVSGAKGRMFTLTAWRARIEP